MESDAAHWVQLQALFHIAEAVPEQDRERILRDRCADSDLRNRVLDLVRAAEKEQAAVCIVTASSDYQLGSIGPYVVIKRLGSGGMGTVYLVERNASGIIQRAALKVLSPHGTGPSFLERFHREQCILASLDHPNITRLLDAGVHQDAQPYLVMEYVEGQRLDVWCDDRVLSVDERLRLFLKICEAVDYAHRNLVVHLDLKPSNILVTLEGTPKVLDFGTSKLIELDGQVTATMPVTASYASPEQLRSETITTASDVYSLGVILFELLAGQRPSGEASLAAMIERAVEEKEPARLDSAVTSAAAEKRGITEGRLRSLLAGDLSTIVRECLSPRPLDRYASVYALSDDIQRYLDARPVLAQRQTTFYHARKFVRRNSGKVAASLVMLIALCAALGYAWWGQQQAVREGQRALRMQAFLYRLFKMANSNFTGKPAATVREFLQLGLQVLPTYIKDPADLRQAQLALGESIFWNGDLTDARQVYEQVEASAKSAGDAGAEAEAQVYLGDIARQEGDFDAALSRTAQALDLSRTRGVPPRTRVLGAGSYALVRENLGRRTEENLRLWEFAVKESRAHGLPPHEIGEMTAYLAAALAARGRLDESEKQYQEALRLYRQDPLALCNQADVLEGLGNVRLWQAREAESIPLYRQAYEASLRCSGPEDRGTLAAAAYWAGALARAGRWQEALPPLESALPAWRRAYPVHSPSLYTELSYLGLAYFEAGRYQDAERLAAEVLAMMDTLQGKLPSTDRRYGLVRWLMGAALAGQGRYREALPHAEAGDRILAGNQTTPLGEKDAAKARALLKDVRSRVH
ncbi:MAG: protein kinase domain-containing protein [Bryobacteraceae bacterium]